MASKELFRSFKERNSSTENSKEKHPQQKTAGRRLTQNTRLDNTS